MTHIDLRKLPDAHRLRNTPLADINAEVRNNAAPTDTWRRVEMHWDIAHKTFNTLPLSWKTYADWRVKQATE